MPEKLPAGAFYGQTICVREVAGFRLTECRFPPGARVPDHVHEAAHFCVVIDGQYVESYDRRVRYCTPRTVIFHPDGEIHSGHISPQGARDLAVEVLPQRLTKVVQDLRILHEPAEFSGGLPARCGLRLYKEFCTKDTASQLAIDRPRRPRSGFGGSTTGCAISVPSKLHFRPWPSRLVFTLAISPGASAGITVVPLANMSVASALRLPARNYPALINPFLQSPRKPASTTRPTLLICSRPEWASRQANFGHFSRVR
jgi:quercetin dioxygenase-like cupin family protein